jgi:primosomal protein N'
VGTHRPGRRPEAALLGLTAPDATLIASVVPLVPVWRVDRTFDYLVPNELKETVRIGSVVRARFGGRNVRAVVVDLQTGSPTKQLNEIGKAVAPLIVPASLINLLRWIARRYVAPAGKVFARVVPPRVRISVPEPVPLKGGEGQSLVAGYDAGNDLIQAIESGRGGAWCLECLPGEDRGRLIAELVHAAGRAQRGAALVCVPEVRYGSVVLEDLGRMLEDVAFVDSARTDGDRSRAWMRLAAGHGVGAGGRAAVLAPVPELRLIVIDEAHHRTYKEDRSPRFDARRVAVERAHEQGAVCVLISPSPPVEFGSAARSGAMGWVRPLRQARRGARPVLEFIGAQPQRQISHDLHQRFQRTLGSGGRVAVLVSGRGYSRSVWCAQCRRSLRCPRCEAGLSYERGRAETPNRLRCLRCGMEVPPPDVCPSCGAADFRWIGAGSQRYEEQLAKSFPRARVVRADPATIGDSVSAPDIYVTTWIGTKESVRPEVDLVAVLDADSLIRRPHFRAAEHAFQALVEMAEWAGPAQAGGRLVIQTDDPSNYVLQALARSDYGYFLERELEQRKELRYPPFSELIRIEASGPEAEAVLQPFATALRDADATVLGPIALQRRGAAVRELLAKCADVELLVDDLRRLVRETPSGTRVVIDVDPA